MMPNTTVRVALENGHQVLAFVSGRLRRQALALGPGDTVTLEMSPYDLSKGCIISRSDG
jgi:translation initiation factor IF-1